MPDYQRPQLPYTPDPVLRYSDRYVLVAESRQPIGGDQLDGEINYIINSLNILREIIRETAAGILPGSESEDNILKFPYTDGIGGIFWTKITASYLSAECVSEHALQEGCVTANKIGDGEIPNEKLTESSVQNNVIDDNSISFNKVTDEDNGHFQQFFNNQADHSLQGEKIMPDSLDGDTLLAGTVPAVCLVDNSITNQQLSPIVQIPVGAMVDWTVPGDATPPPLGWIKAIGQNISRATYSALFELYGTYYGIGDGTTTFGIPDTRGRAMHGVDNGSAQPTGGRIVGNAPLQSGSVGGAETISLTAEQNGPHTHGYSFFNTAFNPANSGSPPTGGVTAATIQTGSSGTGAAHNNMSPYMLMPKIIYAGV